MSEETDAAKKLTFNSVQTHHDDFGGLPSKSFQVYEGGHWFTECSFSPAEGMTEWDAGPELREIFGEDALDGYRSAKKLQAAILKAHKDIAKTIESPRSFVSQDTDSNPEPMPEPVQDADGAGYKKPYKNPFTDRSEWDGYLSGRDTFQAIKTAGRAASPDNQDNCYIIALCAITGEDYQTCDAVASEVCERSAKGATFAYDGYDWDTVSRSYSKVPGREAYLQEILSYFGLQAVRADLAQTIKTPISLKRAASVQRGVYFLMMNHHVSAYVNGHLIDWVEGRRKQIKAVYQVVKIVKAAGQTDSPALQAEASEVTTRTDTKGATDMSGTDQDVRHAATQADVNQEKGSLVEVSKDEYRAFVRANTSLTDRPTESCTMSIMQCTDPNGMVMAQAIYSRPVPVPGVKVTVRYEVRKPVVDGLKDDSEEQNYQELRTALITFLAKVDSATPANTARLLSHCQAQKRDFATRVRLRTMYSKTAELIRKSSQ